MPEKLQVNMRIIVTSPLDGVTMMVQRGKDELLAPKEATTERLVFEFEIDADVTSGVPNFLGKYAQGPKAERFVYVNSGTYAGFHSANSDWNRRAKLPLGTITAEMVKNAVLTRAHIETTIDGVGRDGGPVCATVKGLTWTVASKKRLICPN